MMFQQQKRQHDVDDDDTVPDDNYDEDCTECMMTFVGPTAIVLIFTERNKSETNGSISHGRRLGSEFGGTEKFP